MRSELAVHFDCEFDECRMEKLIQNKNVVTRSSGEPTVETKQKKARKTPICKNCLEPKGAGSGHPKTCDRPKASPTLPGGGLGYLQF